MKTKSFFAIFLRNYNNAKKYFSVFSASRRKLGANEKAKAKRDPNELPDRVRRRFLGICISTSGAYSTPRLARRLPNFVDTPETPRYHWISGSAPRPAEITFDGSAASPKTYRKLAVRAGLVLFFFSTRAEDVGRLPRKTRSQRETIAVYIIIPHPDGFVKCRGEFIPATAL